MKKNIMSVFMLVISMPAAVRAQASPSSPQPLDDSEAYKVYAALLPDEWIVKQARPTTLVFQEETGTMKECTPSGGLLATDWLPILKDFTSANATPKVLRRRDLDTIAAAGIARNNAGREFELWRWYRVQIVATGVS